MNTFWIGGYPVKSDVARIKLFQDSLDLEEGVIPRDGYHVTLKYWEGHPDLKDDVIGWLNDNAGLFGRLRASTHKLERFGKDDDILVARLESEALQGAFAAIEEGLADIGVPKSDYRTYKPHLTLAEGIGQVPQNDLDSLKTITLSGWQMTDENRDVLWSKGDVAKAACGWVAGNCRFASAQDGKPRRDRT